MAILPDNTSLYQSDDFPLWDNSVGEVQAPIFPLNWAVHIQSITQPVIWWTPVTNTKETKKDGEHNNAFVFRATTDHQRSERKVPGLKLFGTEGVCDIFNGVTQTVGVVISGVDAPAEKRKTQSVK